MGSSAEAAPLASIKSQSKEETGIEN